MTARLVTINVKDVELEKVLEILFVGQPLTYSVLEKTISIAPKEKENPGIIEKVIERFPEIDATGVVIDEQGRPIPGATIRVKNGKGATISNGKGEFVLKGVEEGLTAVVTYIGFNAKEAMIRGDMGSIKMETATSKLDVRLR